MTIRWRAFCAYDGTDFAGWQSQPGGNAVQDVLERALRQVAGTPIRIHAASRTDAGVHARAQGVHFDLDWNHPAGALHRAIETYLPDSIRLHGLKTTAENFHARFSATGKRYHYYFSTRPAEPFTVRYRWHPGYPGCDPDRIRTVLPYFAGTHDFRAFAGKVVDEETSEKTLAEPELHDEGNGDWFLRVEGNGFLYRMVRCIAGTVLRVGNGRLSPERIPSLIAQAERTSEIQTAPPNGLFLEEVLYPDENPEERAQ